MAEVAGIDESADIATRHINSSYANDRTMEAPFPPCFVVSTPLPAPSEDIMQTSNPNSLITPASHPKKTDFLDLSAELRIKIYSIALTREEAVEPYSYHREAIRFGHELCAYARIKTVGLSATILAVSKQVNKEATEMLHGNNTFEFFYSGPLQLFIGEGSRYAKFVRHIRLSYPSTSLQSFGYNYRKSLVRLSVATSLETLTLGFGYDMPYEADMASALKPLMLKLQESQSACARPEDTVQFIGNVTGNYRTGHGYVNRPGMSAAAATYTAEVRKHIQFLSKMRD